MNTLSQKRLKELFEYDPLTGIFVWKIKKRNVKQGHSIGDNASKYVVLTVDGVKFLAHRMAWIYMYGEIPDGEIDHINRVKNDNRICNLRVVTRSENQKNMGILKSNTSGITGVNFHKASKKWQARTRINGKRIDLGLFTTKEDAALALSIYAMGAQEQKERDAKIVDHILKEGGGTYGDAIRENKE